MPIRKFRPLSPDPYINKLKGDTEFARLGHLNSLVNQVNTEITQAIEQAKDYKEYVARLSQAPNGAVDLSRLIRDDFNTGGITWSGIPVSGYFSGTPVNDVFAGSLGFTFDIETPLNDPPIIVVGTLQQSAPGENTKIIFSMRDAAGVPFNGAWGGRLFSLKVYF